MFTLSLLVISLLVALACAAPTSSRFVRGSRGQTIDHGEENPISLLWERGVIPDYEDDPDVYRDTAWFLDKIIMDEAEIVLKPIPPEVKYRFGSGDKQECIAGKKTIPPQCQWTGIVIEKGGEPKKLKLSVARKYCAQAGLEMPKPKEIGCDLEEE